MTEEREESIEKRRNRRKKKEEVKREKREEKTRRRRIQRKRKNRKHNEQNYVKNKLSSDGLGSILGHFGGSWRGLGGSWAALGGVLGGLGAVLDRSWAVLVVIGRFRLNKPGRAPDLAKILEPKRGPRWSQNATQEGPKSKTKTKMKKEDFEDRLGAVLGRSWLVLGRLLGSLLLIFHWFL